MKAKRKTKQPAPPAQRGYQQILAGMVELLEAARRAASRSVNSIMTATYWEMGRRIVEYEQGGRQRAGYGEGLLKRLTGDLTRRFGRGFGVDNLELFRAFYLHNPSNCVLERSRQLIPTSVATVPKSEPPIRKSRRISGATKISESLIRISKPPQAADRAGKPLRPSTIDRLPTLADLARAFPLSWTHYVRILRVRNPLARQFYEAEALRGGWSVRQLDRQIGSQFYERTALSRNKTAMLTKGAKSKSEDAVSADEEIKDPFVLEFLGLKDEYSETQLEDALVRHIESFLLELGGAFTFVGRQRRLRIDHEWFRIDLLFFHRRLRSLVIIDLKTGPLTHADIGQMHMYLNYAKAHWMQPDENPPVGLILCTEQGESLAHYALEGLPNKMLVREYLTVLPDEKLLAAEIARTRKLLEGRR